MRGSKHLWFIINNGMMKYLPLVSSSFSASTPSLVHHRKYFTWRNDIYAFLTEILPKPSISKMIILPRQRHYRSTAWPPGPWSPWRRPAQQASSWSPQLALVRCSQAMGGKEATPSEIIEPVIAGTKAKKTYISSICEIKMKTSTWYNGMSLV